MSSTWAEFLADSTLFDSATRLEPFIRLVARYASPEGKLLEAGFGSGDAAVLLADMGYHVTAIDIDEELIRRAKDRYGYWLQDGKLAFERVDIFNLPWTKQAFDVAYHQGVLEHFSDEEIVAALREQARVASWIIFDVPNDRYGHHPFGNERLLPLSHWLKLIELADLKVREIQGRTFPLWTRLLPFWFLSRHRIGPPSFFSRWLARVFIFVCFSAEMSE
jgi:SAM-dependent methyltransferase